jgi:general nucleoside transport system permease protein
MSTLRETLPQGPSKPKRHLPQLSWLGTALVAFGVFAVLAGVRVGTGANDVTSSGTFGAALRLAVPIGLAALGGLYSERAGIVNIGLEGMMILGTWFAAWGGWQWGPWAGVLCGVIGGALGGLLHAVATVTFGVDHVVSGVAINIIALGVTRYLATAVFTGQPGASASLSPPVNGNVGRFTFPFLAGGRLFGWDSPDTFGWLEKKHWFFVSDLAGLVKGMTVNLSWLTIIAVVLVPFSAYVLWHTAFGLRLRSVGEAPTAADSLGVPVYRMKYIGVIISGCLSGLAGAYLVLESAGRYKEGQTGGRGYIGLAALIFGNWMPAGLAMGAGLFGFADALQLRSGDSVRALILFVAIVLGFLALRAIYVGQPLTGAGMIVAAVVFGVYFSITSKVPDQFVTITPYLTTLLVLAFAAQRLRPPAADGQPWRKGQQI